ncbi:hypothetical protein CDD83_5158 [Cordyceps sp. RAO-2017]|nr:hypothetical protein CDD83_5158 [Cordyceps sp. RAO-2017]
MADCREDRSSRKPNAARFPTKFRLRHARSKTGCLTCRQRKKKCDETRPSCASCTRSALDCVWPERPDAPKPRYEHYLGELAVLLQARTSARNPFVTCVLPLAQTDDLLMHAVLAVSGTHLAHKLQDAAHTELATRRHYLRAIRGLHDEIANGRVQEKRGMQSLLMALGFLCQYEVLSIAPSSTFAMHLHAMRYIFARVCEGRLDVTDEALCFAYEGYCFLALSNTITPSIQPGEVLYDLDIERLHGFRKSPTFGAIFAGSHDLFTLIPRAQQLYRRRLTEEAGGTAGLN